MEQEPFILEIYEPTFKEISDPKNLYYDPNWFESDLLPFDHEWSEIIGKFLYMRALITRYEYFGQSKNFKHSQITRINKFKEMLPEIENFIREGFLYGDFVLKWGDFCSAYAESGVARKTQAERENLGKFDRGVEQRRAWYASVYLQEKEKSKKGAVIKRDIAKYAELIKAGKIIPPPYWKELKFEKILHQDSTLSGPVLCNDLRKDMNVKKLVPYYAEIVAPKYKLPPFEIKTSG